MSLFRRATAGQLAASGKTKQLLKRMQPRDADLAESKVQGLIDLNLDRRLDACRALTEIEGDDVTRALLDRLADPVVDLRVEAVRSLLTRDGEHEAAILDSILAWPEEEGRASASAALLLHVRSDPKAAARLVRAYLDSDCTEHWTLEDVWLRQTFNAADPQSRSALMQQAAHGANVQPGATRARQTLGADATLGAEALIARLGDDANRIEVAALLGELRHSSATLPLVGMLEDHEGEVRRAAAEALGHIQDPMSVPALLRRSADNDFAVRNAAQRALDEFGTAGIIWSVSAAANGALDEGDGQPGQIGAGDVDDAAA